MPLKKSASVVINDFLLNGATRVLQLNFCRTTAFRLNVIHTWRKRRKRQTFICNIINLQQVIEFRRFLLCFYKGRLLISCVIGFKFILWKRAGEACLTVPLQLSSTITGIKDAYCPDR